MVVGMVAVFAFLIILIMLMNLLAWVDRTFFPEKPVPAAGPVERNKAEIAAITGAVYRYLRERKR